MTSHPPHNRSHLPGLFGLLVLLAGVILPWPRSQQARAQASRPVVHVFLQLDAKSGAVEKMLQGRLPGLVVTVFGRFRDFDDAANARRPDAVVSIPPVLESRGAKPVLQGTRGGKATEAYVLASVGQPLGGSLAGKTIGVVDLLSREGTQAFITGLLKTTDVKIKRVAKIEDLLPLLEFSAADGVVLPNSMLLRTRVRVSRFPACHCG